MPDDRVMTDNQVTVLCGMLPYTQPRHVAELALGLTEAATTRALGILETDGLVVRTTDGYTLSERGRMVALRITGRGRR